MIGQSLAHYRITEKIGAGGMGEVYKAHDERLDRDVAIKVLPAGTLADENARKRFRKEALALSKLNHPNIATVHDFDTQESVDFIVMELVEGAPLAERVRTGPLPEKEISKLGAQIADALDEAHEHGIVHRDLKPGNIAVTPKGWVKVLDFGLARILRPVSDEATTEALTQEHAVAGTLPYMSPEELRGEKSDNRSDLFSFGVVLYEMATGRRPFEHTISTALADAIIHKPPEPPSTHNRQVSPGLENIIIKALDKDPDHRYQSAREMRVDLERLTAPVSVVTTKRKRLRTGRWFWAAACVVAVIAFLFVLNVGDLRDRLLGEPGPRIDSIAVLPLENLSGDPEQEYFADGMTEALIADLGKIRELRVISRTSVMHYKRVQKPLREIADELGVDAVIEGSVMQSGDRVRITTQLVKVNPEQHLWAERYDRDLRDILSLQSEVAKTIAQEIRIAVSPEEETNLANVRPVDPEAHRAYLRGRFYWNKRTPSDILQAIEYFQQAIDLDPDFALGYAALSRCYGMLGGHAGYLLPPREAWQKAKTTAVKSIDIDPTIAEGHVSLGWVLSNFEWDWVGAEKAFRRAIDLNPGLVSSHHWLADHLSRLGRHQEAQEELRRAQDLDPLNMGISAAFGYFLYATRRYDEAVSQLQALVALVPRIPLAHRLLGFTYSAKKMYDEAIREHQEAVALTGRHSITDLAFLGTAYAAAGRKNDALDILQELEEISTRQYVPAHARFVVHLHMGNKDEACFWLEKTFEEHDWSLSYLKIEPGYDPLRNNPCFQDIVERMNFPE